MPSGSVSEGDKKYWAETILSSFEVVEAVVSREAGREAQKPQESYDRVRKAVKGEKLLVEPILPADVLSISIMLPLPGVL